ncbi:hypothetical protein EJP617_23270 [Erwinia sp. Ejp617]|nr:hypothetical protein EJP617_23270 [Erwinia sp. Ejp617]
MNELASASMLAFSMGGQKRVRMIHSWCFHSGGEIIPPPAGYQSAYHQAVIHAVSDHKHLFAEGDDKYDSQLMRDLRQKNSGILNITAPTELADDTSEQDV